MVGHLGFAGIPLHFGLSLCTPLEHIRHQIRGDINTFHMGHISLICQYFYILIVNGKTHKSLLMGFIFFCSHWHSSALIEPGLWQLLSAFALVSTLKWIWQNKGRNLQPHLTTYCGPPTDCLFWEKNCICDSDSSFHASYAFMTSSDGTEANALIIENAVLELAPSQNLHNTLLVVQPIRGHPFITFSKFSEF